jgi:hypothetical protein
LPQTLLARRASIEAASLDGGSDVVWYFPRKFFASSLRTTLFAEVLARVRFIPDRRTSPDAAQLPLSENSDVTPKAFSSKPRSKFCTNIGGAKKSKKSQIKVRAQTVTQYHIRNDLRKLNIAIAP